MSILETTPKQRQVLKFIEKFYTEKSVTPSLHEIKDELKISSVSTAHKHVTELRKKGLLRNLSKPKRSVEFFDESQILIEIPLLGKISAGSGIEPIENPEPMKVSKELLCGEGRHYALKIDGNSMINDGIKDGDIAVIRSQNLAQDGDVVVAMINEGNERATIKRFYNLGNKIELRAENPDLSDWPRQFDFGDIEIRGKFCGLVRKGG